MGVSKQKRILAAITFSSWLLLIGFQNCSQNSQSQNDMDSEITDTELLNEGRAVLESNIFGSSNVRCSADQGGDGYYPTNKDTALGTDQFNCVIEKCDQGFVPKGEQCVPLDQQPDHDAKVTRYYYESHLLENQIAKVEVTVVNTGKKTWELGKGYRLMLQKLSCENSIWGVQTVKLKSSVKPGESYTFKFKVRAPTLERIKNCKTSGVPLIDSLALDWSMFYKASKSEPREAFGAGTAMINCRGLACFGNQATIHKPEPLKTGCVDISNDQSKTSYFCFDGKSFFGYKPNEPGNLNEGLINDGEGPQELSETSLEKLNSKGKSVYFKSYKNKKIKFKLYSSKLSKWIGGIPEFNLKAEITPAALGEWQLNFKSLNIEDYNFESTANIRKVVRLRSGSVGDLPPSVKDPNEDKIIYTLNIVKTGPGKVMVPYPEQSSTSGTFECGDSCSSGYGGGTTIVLKATWEAGKTFEGWGGACSGKSDICTLTMDEIKNVTATFLDSQQNILPVNPEPSPLYDCKVEFYPTGAGAQVSSSKAQVSDADSCLKYAIDASVSNGYIKSIIFNGDPLKIPFKDCVIDISTTAKSESKTIKEFYNNSQCLKAAMEMAAKSITGSNLDSFIVKMADTTLSYVKSGISTTVMKNCAIKLTSLDNRNSNTGGTYQVGSIGSCLKSALDESIQNYESVIQIEFDGRIILDVNGVN